MLRYRLTYFLNSSGLTPKHENSSATSVQALHSTTFTLSKLKKNCETGRSRQLRTDKQTPLGFSWFLITTKQSTQIQRQKVMIFLSTLFIGYTTWQLELSIHKEVLTKSCKIINFYDNTLLDYKSCSW